jgi:hypothetical protein
VDQDEIEEMAEGLTDIERKILAHIYTYGPDTPWLARRSYQSSIPAAARRRLYRVSIRPTVLDKLRLIAQLEDVRKKWPGGASKRACEVLCW